MKIALGAIGLVVVAAIVAAMFLLPSRHPGTATEVATGASVNVVKATQACFSDTLRVAGYLVPKRVAIVTVDSDGYKITEVSVGEGDQVSSGVRDKNVWSCAVLLLRA